MTGSRVAIQKVMLIGVLVVFVVLGIKCWHKGHQARIEKKQEVAFERNAISEQVGCDSCGAFSDMEVPYTERRRFQVCPDCGEKRARPIVYYTCMNPDCNRQLVKVRNHVFGEEGFSASPDGLVCPRCGRPHDVRPEEHSIEDAKKIAEETGQQFY
jgi:peptide subunit release factor 1 (eRF1)